MLSPDEVAGMRAVMALALPDEAIVQRKTRTSDGGGGFTDAWTDLATVACRIAPVGGGENAGRGGMAGDRVTDETTHVVTFPADTDITEADRVVIIGQAFDVTLVRRRGAWELSRRVEVREAA